MIENETIRSSLICEICDLIYERPVKIFCGKTICNSHLLDSSGRFLSFFECHFCCSVHQVPSKGFHPNFFIKKQIDEGVYLNNEDTTFKKEMNEVLEKWIDLSLTACGDRDNITEYFTQMRSQIVEQRDMLIKQIKNLSENTLEKTRNLELKFKDNLNELKESNQQKIKDLKNDINLQFRHLKPNLNQLKQKLNEAKVLVEKQKKLVQTDLRSYSFYPNSINFEESLIGKIQQNDPTRVNLCHKDSSNLDNETRIHFFDGKHDAQVLIEKENKFVQTDLQLDSQQNASRIITCHKDGSILMRDLDNETIFDYIDGNHDGVNCILISRDGQYLISGGDFIKVWNLETNSILKCFTNLKGKKWGVKCMINSPRANVIIFSSNSNRIHTLDLISYEIKQLALEKDISNIMCLEFLTSDILLSLLADSSIKVWNLNENKCLQTIALDVIKHRCLRKINDTKFALSKNCTIQILGSDKEGNFSSLKTFFTDSTSYINDLKVSLELNVLISASVFISLWSLDDFTCVKRFFLKNLATYRSIEILSNNRLIATNKKDTLVLWCLKTGKSLKMIKDHESLTNKVISYHF